MSCFHGSVLDPCTLSSVCLVSCWSVVFGSRHSCLEFRVSRRGSDTRAPCSGSLRERAVSSSLGCTLFCPCVLHAVRVLLDAYIHVMSCSVWHAACVFPVAVCFRVVVSCVNTWLMSILISCVFGHCFAHGW